MFPQFGATAESLSKASSLVLRMGTDAHLYDDPDDVSIAPLLDSKFDSEKSEALKRLLALIAQGADVSNFFPQVVKNVASQSLEVKKLVYLYLLHYAEKRPDEALLSINYFQKDLSDTNPLVRAYALRAMTGIRLHVVAPLVLVAIGKCARDASTYVRKCAAHALTKLHDLHLEENTSAIEELVSVLLTDQSPVVVGAAAVAFKSVCPDNLSLIGKNFRRLCETLPDVEEWGQIVLIEILLRYVIARHGLVKESLMFTSDASPSSQSDKDFFHGADIFYNNYGSRGDGDDASNLKLNMLMYKHYVEGQGLLSQSGLADGEEDTSNHMIHTSCHNDSVKILLRCTSPLLWSQNSAVVLAAAGLHWVMAPKEEVKRIVKPLLFLLRSSRTSKYVVLCNIQMFAKVVPSIFAPYYEDFFISSSDSYQMRSLKLEILSAIATDSSIPIIFEEFQDYVKDPDRRFVVDTVAAIGLCAQRVSSATNICLDGLLSLTVHEASISNSGQMESEASILVQAIMSIKAIIKQNPVGYEKIIVRLARNLDGIRVPAVRALIIWIVGEYCTVGQLVRNIVPTVLQYLAQCFPSEQTETKHQILSTTAKVVLCTAQEEDVSMFKRILSYIIELARHDLDYDVRDRARTVEKLIPCDITPHCLEEGASFIPPNGGTCHEFVDNLFTRRTPLVTYLDNNVRFYLPGSLSHIVLHAAPGYGPLPKPCSLLEKDIDFYSEMASETNVAAKKVGSGDSFDSNDPEASSISSVEESGCDSQHSSISPDDSEGTGSAAESEDNGHTAALLTRDGAYDGEVPLVHVSDAVIGHSQTNQSATGNFSTSCSMGLTELMSKSALESWLDEQSNLPSAQKSGEQSSGRISINDLGFNVKPKFHTLLDPANGNGLRVEYAFSSEISTISPSLVCVEASFGNCSTEPLTKISVKDDASDVRVESMTQLLESPESLRDASDVPTIVPVEEIATLDPGQTTKIVLQVRFHHHLLPLKLAVLCNGKKHSTKLWPEIGYFMRPLSMNVEAFTNKESQLRGMFEYAKRCTFTDHIGERDCGGLKSVHTDKILVVAQSLASKVLSNANLYLVSVDMPVSFNVDDASGLCLRFSGETLSSLIPCLITVLAEGKCFETLNITVKVNCEETVFGLNLLNRLVAFLN